MGWFNPFRRKKRENRNTLNASATLTRPQQLDVPMRVSRPWVWNLLCLMLVLAAIAGAIYGIRTYLANSPRYRLRQVVINAQTLDEDLLRAYLHIETGTPIFDIDLAVVRKRYLEMSTISSVRVTRKLPDTLVIMIDERDPVARLGRTNLVIDDSGTVFVLPGGTRSLPIITGYQHLRGNPLAPGDKATGLLVSAIELVRYAGDDEGHLPMTDIDLSNSDYLLCTLYDQRQARISWDNMTSRSEQSRESLKMRVCRLLAAMNDSRAEGHSLFDASLDSDTIRAIY